MLSRNKSSPPAVLIALLALLAYATSFAAEPITAEEVETFLDETRTAIMAKDIDFIAASIAPDATISFHYDSLGTDEPITLNRDEYIAALAKVFATTVALEIEIDIKDIEIDPAGKSARVTLTVRERVIWPDREQHSVNEEILLLARYQGRLVAVVITGQARLADPLLTV